MKLTRPSRAQFALFLMVFAFTMAAAWILTRLLPKTYSAKARVQYFEDPAFTTNYDAFDQEKAYRFLSTELDTIQTAPFLFSVIDSLNLNSRWSENLPEEFRTLNTLALLKDCLEVIPVRGARMLTIHSNRPDPNEAAEIANAVAAAYVRHRSSTNGIHALPSGDPSLPSRVEVSDPAVPNFTPVAPNSKRILTIAGIIGLVLGTAAAGALKRFHRS